MFEGPGVSYCPFLPGTISGAFPDGRQGCAKNAFRCQHGAVFECSAAAVRALDRFRLCREVIISGI